MYLVELRPGKEELFRTGDDLAAAIRRGDVDVHSRIYHRATSKWISITLHPQYKAIVAQKATDPLPPMDRNWTYLTAQSEMLEGSDPTPDAIEPSPDLESDGAEPVERAAPPWRRLFAFSMAGLALLFGVQLASSGPRPPWAGNAAAQPAATAAAQDEDRSREEQVISLASTTTAWNEEEGPDEAAPTPAAKTTVASALPRAPSLKLNALGDVLPEEGSAKKSESRASATTVEGLIARYSAAHASARERLEAGMRVARLGKLLASSRLTPNGGVTETRLGLAGVANFIRVYRQQETLIEEEYQDTFAVMSKEHGWPTQALRQWHSRPAPKEPAALSKLSSSLVTGIDNVLALLTEEAGAYKLGEGTIAFEDVEASRRYGRLRRQVSAAIDSARVAGGEESTGPMSYLLEAIGTTRLPREI